MNDDPADQWMRRAVAAEAEVERLRVLLETVVKTARNLERALEAHPRRDASYSEAVDRFRQPDFDAIYHDFRVMLKTARQYRLSRKRS